MSKPIFIVKVPITFTKEKCDYALDGIKEKLKDYHVIMVVNTFNDWGFQLFSDRDIQPIEFEKLKAVITE